MTRRTRRIILAQPYTMTAPASSERPEYETLQEIYQSRLSEPVRQALTALTMALKKEMAYKKIESVGLFKIELEFIKVLRRFLE